MVASDHLSNVTLRLPPHVRKQASEIAECMSGAIFTVTESEVMRRALILGLDQLAREWKQGK